MRSKIKHKTLPPKIMKMASRNFRKVAVKGALKLIEKDRHHDQHNDEGTEDGSDQDRHSQPIALEALERKLFLKQIGRVSSASPQHSSGY